MKLARTTLALAAALAALAATMTHTATAAGPADGRAVFGRIPAGLQQAVKQAGNTFEELKP